MTINDANKLLALAKANYSYAFKGMSKQEMLMLVQSWAFALQDIPADIVLLAFMQLLSTCKWLPTVAEIREQIKTLYYEALPDDSLDRIMEQLGQKPKETDKSRAADAAKKYIRDHTWQLRGDEKPGLTLDAILDGTYLPAIGSGQMEFVGIGSATDYLPEPEK